MPTNRHIAAAAKVEATAGTAETVTMADNAIQLLGVAEPEIFYLAPNGREELVTGSLDPHLPAAPAGLCARLPIRWAARGAGSAYAYTNENTHTLPEAHPLYRAAGFGLAVTGGAGSEVATYAVASDPVTTITFKYQLAAKQFILSGAVFERLVLNLAAGQFPVFEGTLVGLLTEPTQQALEAATYDTVAHPIWKGASSLVIDSYSPEAQTLVVDFGLAAAPNVSANATDGLTHYKVVGRGVRMTAGYRVPALATYNPRTKFASATAIAVDATVGATQYARMKLNADNVGTVNVQHVADGEFRNYTHEMLCGYHASHVCSLVFD